MTAPAATIGPGKAEKTIRLAGTRDPFGLDLYQGLQQWPLWTMLGWNDIRQRYRRSTLGPFWITLSTGLFILVLGVIYGRLFKMDVASYLPYFAVGFVVWNFIASTTIDCCSAFLEGERIIKQIKRPFSVYVLRVIWRDFVAFLHTAIVFVPLLIIFHVNMNAYALLAIPGLALVLANQIWIGLVVAILNTRFRDVLQMVTTAAQMLFFATPIMYPVNELGSAIILAYANPAFHLIEIVRAPLLGEVPMVLSWLVALGTLCGGYLLALALCYRVRHRIVYWL
jgi:ABC-type polysaccharide/polyol phosphate export permease